MVICGKRVFPWIEIKMEPELMIVDTGGSVTLHTS